MTIDWKMINIYLSTEAEGLNISRTTLLSGLTGGGPQNLDNVFIPPPLCLLKVS